MLAAGVGQAAAPHPDLLPVKDGEGQGEGRPICAFASFGASPDAPRSAHLAARGFGIFRMHNQEGYDNFDGVPDTRSWRSVPLGVLD